MVRYCDAYWDDVDRATEHILNLKKVHNNSILITGGTGMICSTLVDLLLQYNRKHNANIKIFLGGRSLERVCSRFEGFQNEEDFFFIPYDATTGQDLKISADYIIHGASNADPAVFVKEPVETMLANITGLYSALTAAYQGRSKRLLYISSSEVYGNIDENRPYLEEDYGYVDILNPRAAYPSSKRAAETLCAAYGQEYGLDTVIVRPGHIYGPTITDADSRATAQFTRDVARGENIVMKSTGSQLRSYCYTLDCASAILTVLLNGENGNAYNISNRDSVVSILDIAEKFAQDAGQQIVFENPDETEKQGYNMMLNSSLNAEKLEKLGWKAIFSLDEGVKRTIAFYK